MHNYKSQLIDYLCQFIRIPSRSSALGGEEGELQHLIADHMRRLGARVRLIETSDLPDFQKHPLCHGPDRRYENRPTVIGELGPEDGPALLILAHSDTVQIFDPQLWTIDPFGGEVRDGSVHGLGSSDDKWGLATMLALMQAVQDLTQPLKRKLIFASTVDEENGVGNGTLLLNLAGVKAEAALYLDGYGMEIDIGCLGGSNLYLRPKAPTSQSQMESDLAALTEACKTFSRRRAPLFERQHFAENAMKDCSVRTVQRTDEKGPFILVLFYTLPGEDPQRFCNSVEEVIGSALGNRMSSYEKRYRQPWFEPSLVPVDTPLVKLLGGAVLHILGQAPTITTISKQDSFVLTNHAAIPTIAFGCTRRSSGRGSFHNPDERLEVNEVWDAFRIVHFTVCKWLKAG